MYQLFKFGTLSLKGSSSLSLRNLSENYHLTATEKTFLLCKHLNINSRIQVQNLSSVVNLNISRSKKNKQKNRRLKKFTDVFVVTDKFSGLQKANVTKLSPTDLNLLTINNLNLNELYKLKELTNKALQPYTYSNLANDGVTSNDANEVKYLRNSAELSPDPVKIQTSSAAAIDISKNSTIKSVSSDLDIKTDNSEFHVKIDNSEFPVEGNSFEFEIENELSFNSLGITNCFQPEPVEEECHQSFKPEVVKKKKKGKNASDQQHRDEVASRTLAAYIEACNHLKIPEKGMAALMFHNSRTKRGVKANYVKPTKNINVYCSLLKGFAHTGNYIKLTQVLNIMEEEGVQPNLQCYVAIFQCLGRNNVHNHYLKDIRIYAKEALSKNITFDKLMTKGAFLNDERELVLKALQAYDPDYVPVYGKPNVWYNNRLLNHLNQEQQQNYKLNNSKENGGLFTPSYMNLVVKEQVKMEQEALVTIKSIEAKPSPTNDVFHYRNVLNEHYKMWEEAAQKAFTRDLAALSAQKSVLNLDTYMRCLPIKDFVNIMVDEAKRIAMGSLYYSPHMLFLHKILGQKVYMRYNILMKQKTGVLEKMLKIHTKYCLEYAALHGKNNSVPEKEFYVNPRVQWQLIEHSYANTGSTLNTDHQPWVPSVLSAIGKFLYHIIIHDMKIDVNCVKKNSKTKNFLPAFYPVFRTQSYIVYEQVKPHPVLSKLYYLSQPETLTFPVSDFPMMCPPVPWTSTHNGGYLITPTQVVRIPGQASIQKLRMKESDPVQLYPSFDSVNQLGSVPWKVNTKILDLVLKVFQNGGSAELDIPQPPSSLAQPPSETADMNDAEKYQLVKQKWHYNRKKREMYSLWCECLYRLSMANHLRERIFWLPHNMDFRGRVYSIPPHLNHLGSDLARSLLVFAESRPLGPDGLDWLKIHLINLTGLKKRNPIKDRLDYANSIMDLILDSADNPLNGKKWWSKSEEPWQTLACCMEIADVIRSGMDPAEYRSHFPIHQDGSCNGLQHYAALGRDIAGAYSVNLTRSELPQDVYTAVANLVEKQRAKDEADGVKIAEYLNGFVCRKVIKQTVMTTVYGVTKHGAKLQISKRLKEIDSFPKDILWLASSYLTGLTFESLRTMFTSSKEIQDWLTECAKLISGISGKHVEWVTPLGLPVVQPYIKYSKLSMPSEYESYSLDQYDMPNVMKHKNAFAPNFIHSLDSSHMMLTSLHCERAGITFVSVHDCYWTHPSTVHIMSKICREQFIALHSEPVLENLALSFRKRYGFDETSLKDDPRVDVIKASLNPFFNKLPEKGDFDLKNILESVYFFS